MKRIVQISVVAIFSAVPCLSACGQSSEIPLGELNLPDGFEIELYARIPGARTIKLTEHGTLFVGTRHHGKVYAVVDRDVDGSAATVYTVDSDLTSPNGIAFRDGDLYVAEPTRLLRYDDIESRLDDPPEPVVVTDDLPRQSNHGWRYIDFGPDERLYMSIGAPCNVCDEPEPFASIISMKADASDRRIVARGVRNSVGFDWHPATGDFWFTDNGRDMLGDDRPPCELNRLTEPGAHFGYPYIHGSDIPDPEFGEGVDPADYVAPAQNLGPHVAPLGLEFYDGRSFPEEYVGRAFIAEHGSWNRSKKIGYRVTMVDFDENGQAISYEPFVDGWLQGQQAWGRPVDLEIMDDGSLLISDDGVGAVYRVSHVD